MIQLHLKKIFEYQTTDELDVPGVLFSTCGGKAFQLNCQQQYLKGHMQEPVRKNKSNVTVMKNNRIFRINSL